MTSENEALEKMGDDPHTKKCCLDIWSTRRKCNPLNKKELEKITNFTTLYGGKTTKFEELK